MATRVVAVCMLASIHATPVIGQLRNANWLRSNYWITFANGDPENLAPSPNEPIANLSDTSGNMLVYFTVGGGGVENTGVRGPDHEFISGNPTFDGSFFGIQSGIFIPKPGDAERAFLIAWNRLPWDVSFRFGMLEVFLGNEADPPQVLSPEYSWFMTGAACKRMVVPHANGVDYWFVGQLVGTNEYHAYLVTSTGLSPTPVVSNVGEVPPALFRYGKLIPTVDGTRFVSVSETLNYEENAMFQPSITEVLAFDPGTGVIQHQVTLDAPVRVDGVEFSPSGRFLYARHWLFANPLITHQLFQYDLEASDPNTAPQLMDSYPAVGLSGFSTNIIAHAPDGKIYVSHYVPSMGVISEPDLPYPQCAYEHDGYLALGAPAFLPASIKRYNDPPVIGPLGISDRSAMETMATALPNPLQGAGELRLPGATGPVALQWLDAQGRVVRSSTVSASGDRVPLDATGLAAGHYLLRAQVGEKAPVVVRVSLER